MRRLKTDTIVQVSMRNDVVEAEDVKAQMLSSSARSMSMPAVDREHDQPMELLLPSPRAQEPQLQGRPNAEYDSKDEAQVQVQDFAPDIDSMPSSVDVGETGQADQDAEDAEDSDDISPGGHHHNPGYARRLRRARRDVRWGVRARNGVGGGGAEVAAGREYEEEREEEEGAKEEGEKEEEEHGLAEVFERFRTWKWSGQ